MEDGGVCTVQTQGGLQTGTEGWRRGHFQPHRTFQIGRVGNLSTLEIEGLRTKLNGLLERFGVCIEV